MNLQVIAGPAGDIRWVSGALPGSACDKEAEWVWGVLDEFEAAGLITLTDKVHQGTTGAKIPYRITRMKRLITQLVGTGIESVYVWLRYK
jgi:hypothetical protein